MMRFILWRWLCLLFLLGGILWGCAGSRQKDPAVLMRSQRVQAEMVEIASALEQYRMEHGFFPDGLATLRDGNLLSIMPDLEREWAFSFFVDGGRVMMIEAVSLEPMPDGPMFRITFRVPDNEWEGYGITVWPIK